MTLGEIVVIVSPVEGPGYYAFVIVTLPPPQEISYVRSAPWGSHPCHFQIQVICPLHQGPDASGFQALCQMDFFMCVHSVETRIFNSFSSYYHQICAGLRFRRF